MADTNFDRLAVSIKKYIDDKTKNSSSSPVDMNQYVKKRELSTVATSGSYLDLINLPATGAISKDEFEKLLANNKASNNDISNIIKDMCNVTITPGTIYSGYIDLNQLYAVMEAMKIYVDSIYAKMEIMEAEIDYIKKHCSCIGGGTTTTNKIPLVYDDDTLENVPIKGLIYEFEDSSTETETNDKITLEYGDGTAQEVGGATY